MSAWPDSLDFFNLSLYILTVDQTDFVDIQSFYRVFFVFIRRFLNILSTPGPSVYALAVRGISLGSPCQAGTLISRVGPSMLSVEIREIISIAANVTENDRARYQKPHN